MSGVQFNLLPDSKLALNRAQHNKRLVFSISFIAVAFSVGLLVLMLGLVDGVQKKLMNSAANNVDNASKQLSSLNVDKIITVQNQLQALTTLHQNKHIASRIFTYLPKITPNDVSINKLDLDLLQNTLTISGTADSQKSVNTFIDSLKLTTFTVGSGSQPAPAFQQVVESGFSLNAGNVGYTIDMQFDAQLFANNLKDPNGNPVVPQISVNSNNVVQRSGSVFNSSQSSSGTQ